MNVDLPNLTSIYSQWPGSSFYWPYSVTLESISEYWILMVFRYSKSSKCQTAWFIQVRSIEINFEYCLIDLISFIDVSSTLADLVEIKDDSDSDPDSDLLSDYPLIRIISIDCLFVCFKPILNPNAWFYDYQNIDPSCLIMMFSLPFLQWYWIRIAVLVNQPFILIIIIVITNDPTITYWTFTNDNDCNLPIIPKGWFELGFVQYW